MVLDAINQLKLRSTILDGEIVALDAEGIPRFQLLQHDKWSFQQSDFNRKGSWTKVVQSFVIRDLLKGKIPDRCTIRNSTLLLEKKRIVCLDF